MFYLFAGLSAILLLEAVLTLKAVIRFRNFFFKELSASTPVLTNWPRVALIAPCKGLESGIEDNVESWVGLDYPNFKIFFVVESVDDPVVPLLRKYPLAHLLIAGQAQTSGQKVHNLIYAIQNIPEEYEVFAFIDSDCNVRTDWLKNMITKIIASPSDAASGYRWFSNDSNLGSLIRAAWNSSVLTLYKEHGENNFAWGGSTGISRETFVKAQVSKFWEGSISDDYSLTIALKVSGRRINFVPGSLAYTHDSITVKDFMHWAFRQLLITRIYNPRLWFAALAFHVLWFIWIAIGVGFPVHFILTFLAIQSIQAFKADLRWQCIHRIHGSSTRQRVSFWFLGPVIGLFNFALLCLTPFTSKIRWRGVEYAISDANHVKVFRR